jgi:hypothetical protein
VRVRHRSVFVVSRRARMRRRVGIVDARSQAAPPRRILREAGIK